MFGEGMFVDVAVSAGFCISVFAGVEGAERKSVARLGGLVLLLLALAFAAGFAFAALVAGGGALTALRLDASSAAVRASATLTSVSRPALPTVAGGGKSPPPTPGRGRVCAGCSARALFFL